MSEKTSDHPESLKINRVEKKYDINNLDEHLIKKYTRETDPLSLRELAAYCNQRILQAALEEQGAHPLDGEVENLYTLLTDEDVSSGVRTEAKNRVKSEGVDIEAVLDNFVSYQTIRRYLNDHLNITREKTYTKSSKRELTDRIFSLESRLQTVTTETIQQMHRNHGISVGNADVRVNVTVSCEECGQYCTVREFVNQGGCNCN